MKNFVGLTPLVVSLSLSILMLLGRNQHRISSGDTEIYYFPSPYKWSVVFVSLFWTTVPFWPGARGDAAPVAWFSFFFVVWLLTTVLAFYLHRYRVVVEPHNVSAGALFIRSFPFSEIVDKALVNGEYRVHLRDGTRLRLSSHLVDFPRLKASLQPWGTDSPPLEQTKWWHVWVYLAVGAMAVALIWWFDHPR